MTLKSVTKQVYILLFTLIVFLGGLLSYRLADYYVNDIAINNNIMAQEDEREALLTSLFPGKGILVDGNSLIRRVLGQREMNKIVRLNNGYLADIFEDVPDEMIDEYASNVEIFYNYLEGKGIKSIFVMAPYTVSKYDNQLPVGLVDYANADYDYFIEQIDAVGMDYIDVREELHKDGIDQYSMMYHSDPHYTTECGFYVYKKIEKYIKKQLGCYIDPAISDEKQYDIIKYPAAFYGHNVERSGRFFGKRDDYTLMLPRFEKTLDGVYGKGRIEDSVLTMDMLYEEPLRVYASTTNYCTNEDAGNDVKIFVVGDSFAHPINACLDLAFREVATFYNLEIGALEPEVIENGQPDIVIMVYYPGSTIVKNSPAFNYSKFGE